MTDRPIDPNDPNATARYDAPAEPSTPPPAAAATPPPAEAPPPTSWSNPAPSPAAPAWRPPASGGGHIGSIVVGLVLLAIGLWFFADQTLGLDMPRIRWSQLWPVFIIIIGLWIAAGSFRRRSR